MESITKTLIVPPVTFTESAIREIKRLMSAEGFDPDFRLRVGVKGGGCTGMTYILDFESQAETDQEFQVEGISCIINPSHSIYLQGMEVNWKVD